MIMAEMGRRQLSGSDITVWLRVLVTLPTPLREILVVQKMDDYGGMIYPRRRNVEALQAPKGSRYRTGHSANSSPYQTRLRQAACISKGESDLPRSAP